MDRHEVTNREYKEFVEARGYEQPEYWVTPLIRDGREVSWKDAMAFFRDRTNRTGPATWEVGDYRDGLDDHPVGGVSWYEAAAYARWAEKSLPTVFHWNQIAMTWRSADIVPLANFSGDGPHSVSHRLAMHRFGVVDLAGNVREWVKNSTARGDSRLILGGGWNDPVYAFYDIDAQSPWDRSPTNGFRCIRYLHSDGETEALTRTIKLPFRDFYNEEPATDDTFAIWLTQYKYDHTPLEATVDAEEVHDEWIRQTITFKAAYGGERMTALLFLPKVGKKPFRTVVYFPGGNAVHNDSSASIRVHNFDYLLKSGLAVMYPIYKGTYERGDELDSDYPEETIFYKEHVIMWAKDLSRSIDYLETRRWW